MSEAGIAKVQVTLQGVVPLLCHNGLLCDPFHGPARAMKEVTKKRTKTEDDLLLLRKLEFLGGLYLDESGKPCLTADVILGLLSAAGAKLKSKKPIQAGVFTDEDFFPLEYPGSKDPETMYSKKEHVHVARAKVGTSAIMRVRPRFKEWKITFTLNIVTDVVDEKTVRDSLELAGRIVGLGDWRPRYGRYNLIAWEKVA
jgi:hypothetical protein